MSTVELQFNCPVSQQTVTYPLLVNTDGKGVLLFLTVEQFAPAYNYPRATSRRPHVSRLVLVVEKCSVTAAVKLSAVAIKLPVLVLQLLELEQMFIQAEHLFLTANRPLLTAVAGPTPRSRLRSFSRTPAAKLVRQAQIVLHLPANSTALPQRYKVPYLSGQRALLK